VLKFAAADTVDWSDGISIASSYLCTNPVPGSIVLDGGVSVQTGETPVQIGGDRQNPAKAAARLVVKRAMLTNKNPAKHESESAVESALVVGGCVSGGGTGVLELHNGAVVTNKLLVGGYEGSIDPTKGSGNGGVWQFGGLMTALGSVNSHQFGGHLGLDADSHGGYEMHGGTFTALGAFQIGYYGSGVWSQYGGKAVFTNELGGTTARSHNVGGGNYGRGSLYLRGGRIDSHGAIAINSGGHPSLAGFGHLAVDGGAAYFDAHDATVTMNQSANSKGSAFLEINRGGRFRAKTVCAYYRDNREGYIGFNGGVFEKSVDGNPKDFFQGANYRPTRITVYPLGAVFDTAGCSGSSIVADLEGTRGNGVLSIPLAGPVTDPRMVAAPLVMIEGDGHGASAMAEFDPLTGAVTNVLVTAAGWDYSAATAKLMIARSAIARIPCEIGAVPNTGTITKLGEGDLTLYGTNTYGGATVLAGGVLRLGSDGALPAGTRIELAGGTIDANGFEETLPPVWEIDALKAYAAGGFVYDGDLVFPAGATLRVLNLGKIPDNCPRLKILTVTGNISSMPPLVDVDATDKMLTMSGGVLRMNSRKGMTVIVK
jgi:autotransporter-associated beta strand protein